MTPAELAKLHRSAFANGRPWSEAEFENLLADDLVQLVSDPHGFGLSRTIAGESELLTLAVDPQWQRRGIGRKLLQRWLDALDGHATTAFLEVAEDNAPAWQLYQSVGFAEVGRRASYYSRNDGARVDAILLRLDLT